MNEDAFASVQKALSERKRVEILESIRKLGDDGGATCSMVLNEMSMGQSTFSHHVAELAKADLINCRKEGRFQRLTVNEPVVAEYLEELRRKMLG